MTLTAQLQIAQPHPDREDVHLAPIGIDVVLALYRMPCCLQDAGQAGPIGRAAAVSHMQWSGRIGRYVLHGDAAFFVHRFLTELLALLECVLDHGGQGEVGQKKVDETRAGDFRLFDLT